MRTKTYPCGCTLTMPAKWHGYTSVAPETCPVHPGAVEPAGGGPEEFERETPASAEPPDEERQGERRRLATRLFEDALVEAGAMTERDLNALATRVVFAADALLHALAEKPDPEA